MLSWLAGTLLILTPAFAAPNATELAQILAQAQATLASTTLTDAEKIQRTQALLERVQTQEPETFDAWNYEDLLRLFNAAGKVASKMTREVRNGSTPIRAATSIAFKTWLNEWIQSTLVEALGEDAPHLYQPRIAATIEFFAYLHRAGGGTSQRVVHLINEARRREELRFLKIPAINPDTFPAEEVDGLRAQVTALRTELRDLHDVILDPTIVDSDKKRQINLMFQSVEDFCVHNCAVALQVLESVRTAEGNQPSHDTLFDALNDAANIEQNQEPANMGQAAVRVAWNAIKKISEHPEQLQNRIRAAIHLLRYIVSLEEEALFKILSQDPAKTEEGYRLLQQDIGFYRSQVFALVQVGKVVARASQNEKITETEIVRTVEAIHGLGLFYIKLAQTLSNLSFMIDPAIVGPLKVFQEHVPKMPADQVVRVITEELGRSPYDLFIDFDPDKPVATGSNANTYFVVTRDEGLHMAFKVQREDAAPQLLWNRKLNRLAINAFYVFTPDQYVPVLDFLAAQVFGMEDAMEGEFDFNREALNLIKFRRYFTFVSGVRIPRPYRKYTAKRVLGMEIIPGNNIDAAIDLAIKMPKNDPASATPREFSLADLKPSVIERLAETNIDVIFGATTQNIKTEAPRFYAAFNYPHEAPPALESIQAMGRERFAAELLVESKKLQHYEVLFQKLLESFLYMLVIGEVHADLHPGNIKDEAVQELIARLGILDFGQVVRTKGFLIQPIRAIYYFLMGNPEGFARMASLMGQLPGHNRNQLIETAKEVFERHGIPRLSWAQIAHKKATLAEGDAMSKALQEFLTIAYRDYSYRVSSKYAQLVRSLLPVSGLLFSIANRMPIERVALISVKETLKAYPFGILRKEASIIPATLGELTFRVQGYFSGIQRARLLRNNREELASLLSRSADEADEWEDSTQEACQEPFETVTKVSNGS